MIVVAPVVLVVHTASSSPSPPHPQLLLPSSSASCSSCSCSSSSPLWSSSWCWWWWCSCCYCWHRDGYIGRQRHEQHCQESCVDKQQGARQSHEKTPRREHRHPRGTTAPSPHTSTQAFGITSETKMLNPKLVNTTILKPTPSNAKTWKATIQVSTSAALKTSSFNVCELLASNNTRYWAQGFRVRASNLGPLGII